MDSHISQLDLLIYFIYAIYTSSNVSSKSYIIDSVLAAYAKTAYDNIL